MGQSQSGDDWPFVLWIAEVILLVGSAAYKYFYSIDLNEYSGLYKTPGNSQTVMTRFNL